jgi:hypothetical protein
MPEASQSPRKRTTSTSTSVTWSRSNTVLGLLPSQLCPQGLQMRRVQVADQPERRVVLANPPFNLACHLRGLWPLLGAVDDRGRQEPSQERYHA